jgi:hypothetical protein
MSGATPLLARCAFMACTGINLPYFIYLFIYFNDDVGISDHIASSVRITDE